MTPLLFVLIALCLECLRESGIVQHAFGFRASYRFAMWRPFWSERKTLDERVDHARHEHIDLLSVMKRRSKKS